MVLKSKLLVCKHTVYTTIVNFQMNLVHRRKIKNRKKKKKKKEFIEIWHIRYFKYVDLSFNVKMFFIKYMPIARPKLVPKWKMLRIYWNLAEFIFQICWSRFRWQKSPPVRPKFVPKLKVFEFIQTCLQLYQTNFWTSLLVIIEIEV